MRTVEMMTRMLYTFMAIIAIIPFRMFLVEASDAAVSDFFRYSMVSPLKRAPINKNMHCEVNKVCVIGTTVLFMYGIFIVMTESNILK
jgi:hypothetical protein